MGLTIKPRSLRTWLLGGTSLPALVAAGIVTPARSRRGRRIQSDAPTAAVTAVAMVERDLTTSTQEEV